MDSYQRMLSCRRWICLYTATYPVFTSSINRPICRSLLGFTSKVCDILISYVGFETHKLIRLIKQGTSFLHGPGSQIISSSRILFHSKLNFWNLLEFLQAVIVTIKCGNATTFSIGFITIFFRLEVCMRRIGLAGLFEFEVLSTFRIRSGPKLKKVIRSNPIRNKIQSNKSQSDSTIVCKNVLENILSVIPCLLSPPPISNVDYLDSTTLCNTKITIFNIDMGEGGKNSSHITENSEKMHFPKIFAQDCN